jgi:hypothetical protein
MKFKFEDLNNQTRQGMLDEIMDDISRNRLYASKRFNENGYDLYRDLLRASVIMGDEEILAADLKALGCFKLFTEKRSMDGISLVRVPETACETLAQGEFNRYYCKIAIATGRQLIIYRARFSQNPRIESEMMIGKFIDPEKLLTDLRNNIGVETALGIPGINSGLSVKIH